MTYSLSAKVKIFPQKGGWVYISVPKKTTEPLEQYADRGLIPIRAMVGETFWDTSLLPMGDGTKFIALNAKVRKQEKIEVGDTIKINFQIRN